MTRHGGKILADQLRIQGVTRVFCVPGESYLAALDGLADGGIDVIICRQEGGAAMMAEAHGKLTGTPGVCFVTRGPGATNASAGVHIAYQDSSPMILFVGQVGLADRDREAFQEVDYRRMFAPLAKWVGEIETTARIPEYVSHAFHKAVSGRPGPIVLALPEDVLSATADVPDAPRANPAHARIAASDIAVLEAELMRAERPFLIVGGAGWTAEAGAAVAAFCERTGLPVGASFRCQDFIDNDSPAYAGDVGIAINPKLAARVKAADLLIVLGARLGEMTTGGYTLFDIPKAAQRLVHVHPGADEIGRVFHADVAICAASPSVAAALGGLAIPDGRWSAAGAAARADYEAWQVTEETPGAVKMEAVVTHLRDTLPPDTIITNGAGNYATWVHRYNRYRRFKTQLAPTSGSMGYGLPAAVAAKLQHPDRDVVCFAGDGCIQMTLQELATAAQFNANILVIVCDNGIYGTIRMHQERTYPGRVCGTTMKNPDFAALARAYGFHAETVDATAGFAPALARAREATRSGGVPALLHLKTDPEAITPRLRLSQLGK